jgi:hypothetical protein
LERRGLLLRGERIVIGTGLARSSSRGAEPRPSRRRRGSLRRVSISKAGEGGERFGSHRRVRVGGRGGGGRGREARR